MDRFSAMSSFRRVVDAGSFSAAARQLGLSVAAVSKQIASLEEVLGTRLLHRTTRSVTPTEIGASYHRRCVQILDDLEEAESAARAEHAEPRGWVRVNAPVSFGLVHLGAMVARFRARHPDVQVHLTLTDEHIDPTAEGVDVVLRITRQLADTSLMSRRLGTMTRVLCAAPAYLERRGEPASPADLTGHDCLVYSSVARPERWEFEGQDGPLEVEVAPCLAANNSMLLRDAVLAGAGVAVIPSYVVEADLAAGRLRPLIPSLRPVEFGIHALYPRPRHRSARVRAFVDALAAELGA